MRFAFFFLAEYANMFVVGAVAATLFLGGWLPPVDWAPFNWVPGPVWFSLKALALVFVQMWMRWALPRLRVDQLMYMCWKVLLPASLGLVLGAGVLAVYWP
jgi:NADH-quinone oxidoreductase subunit H